MGYEKRKALLLIGFFFASSFGIGMLLSQELAEFSLWIMPALNHLYPIAIISFVFVYSVITSRPIFWLPLFLLLAAGLVWGCILFWLMKLIVFKSHKTMALSVFGELVVVYGATLVLYFHWTSPRSLLKKRKKE